MTLDARYVVTSDVDTFFVNKDTGLPLSNGQLKFYRDSARNVPKAVYEISGTPPGYSYTNMGSTVALSNAGTVNDSQGANEVIYYFPYITDVDTGREVLDLYYVVCEDANGVVQFTREAWPNIASISNPAQDAAPLNNQIANPTFTNLFINESAPMTLSVSGAVAQEIPIAPDWSFVLSGTGSVIVEKVLISGFDNVITNPPFALEITVGVGITTCLLRQRFSANSGLWSSATDNLIYLTGSFVAINEVAGTVDVSMFYAQSNGTIAASPIEIFTGTVTSAYGRLQGGTATAIPLSDDHNSGNDGYVDVYLSLEVNTHISITSIQLVPSFVQSDTSPYDLNSSNRNEAFQGDYYIPRLNAKNMNSYLVGWDFPVNPFQFGSAGGFISTPSAYIADQTIIVANAGGTTTTRWDVDTMTRSLQLGFLAAASPNQSIYIMQYLTGNVVKKLLGNPLSVNVFGYQTAGSQPVVMRVYLFSSPSGSPVPTGSLPDAGTIGSMDANGVFTVSASGWVTVPRSGLDTAKSSLNVVSSNPNINSPDNDYGFSQWQITDSTQLGNTANFAIVVTFAAASTATIKVTSISLVPGDIPCRPAIQSQDEVLRQCQFYYSKSFAPATAPATTAGVDTGEADVLQTVAASTASFGPIVRFPTSMRALPVITLYNPAAGNAQIRNETAGSDWTSSVAAGVNVNGFHTTGTTPGGSAVNQLCGVHWSADSRLGF